MLTLAGFVTCGWARSERTADAAVVRTIPFLVGDSDVGSPVVFTMINDSTEMVRCGVCGARE